MRADPSWLLLFTAVFSASSALVLVLRGPLRRLAGAGAAYGLWGVVALVPLALLLPAPTATMLPMAGMTGLARVSVPGGVMPLAGMGVAGGWAAWLAGALACLGTQLWRQHRFVRALGALQPLRHPRLPLYRAKHDPGLPALVGLWRPRVVVPPDFEQRYDATQRALLLRHEYVHHRRGDLPCNALATLLLSLQWFNPLAHLALAAFRRDQEMACDARVLSGRPRLRRPYAEAMLIGGLHMPLPPLGCPWPSRHPLKERLEMLRQPATGPGRRLGAALMIGLLAAGGGYAAWAAQPAVPVERRAAATSGQHTEARPPAQDISRLSEVATRSTPPPRYPKAAYEQGLSGQVLLRVAVRADGSVADVVVEESRPVGVFDEVSVAAARQWQFRPAMRGGRPVSSEVRVPVTFEVDPSTPVVPAPPAMAAR